MPDQSLLDGAKTKTKLSIETSSLAVDGLGLIATAVIPAGEDVFSKQQILNIADSAHLITTCDCCFIWLGDSVNLRTYTISAENSGTILKKCGGCQVVRYCSTVSYHKLPILWWILPAYMHPLESFGVESNHTDNFIVLSTKSLEKPSQG